MNANDLFNSFWVRFVTEAARHTYSIDIYRATLDPQEFIDSLTFNQLRSKERLYEIIRAAITPSIDSIQIAGGWYGLTALLAAVDLDQSYTFGKDKVRIYSIDQSLAATSTAQALFRAFESEFRYADLSAMCSNAADFRVTDYLGYLRVGRYHMAVNPSVEHFDTKDLERWYENLPNNTRVILCSTDMQAPDHCNTHKSAFQLAAEATKLGLAVYMYQDLELEGCSRFYVQGHKK